MRLHTDERRVTIDIDDRDPLAMARAYYGLRAAGAHDVETRVSSSGDGFHVKAWFDADEIDTDDERRLRFQYGDDVRRVDLDDGHVLKPRQILFTDKPGTDGAGAWHADPWVALDDAAARGVFGR